MVNEAKVKFGNSGVTQAFLLSELMLPHIDVLKYDKGKIFAANFWKGGSSIEKSLTSTGGGRYSSDFHIVSLLWSLGKH